MVGIRRHRDPGALAVPPGNVAPPTAGRAGTLDAAFGLPGGLRFRQGPGGLLFADIHNAAASATVCLQGAQLLHWQPHAQPAPVLWLSDAAHYAPGRAIRGGVPVCWPWFGPSASGTGPAHGFVRTGHWDPVGSRQEHAGATRLRLQFCNSARAQAPWPADFLLTLEMRIGATLGMVLETRNTGTRAFAIGEALHSYFRVGNVAGIAIAGLDGAAYSDNTAAGRVARQHGPVHIGQELDRRYRSRARCRIDDPQLRRSIHIAKRGSATTVVWNPWSDKAARLGDLGSGAGPGDGWRQMVCVESANAEVPPLVVAPGACHRLQVRVRVTALA